MKNWVEQFEYEEKKLNQLGKESLANGIPLYANDALQAQSRKVDELIVQFHRIAGLRQQSS